MPVLLNPESEYAKEKRKFEQPNYNPAEHPYPRMLYLAKRLPNGKFSTFEPMPSVLDFRDEREWERACEQAKAFARSCQKIVMNEAEHKAARESGEGWRDSHAEAVQFQETLQRQISDAAAERAYRDRGMSERAKAESKRAEEAHFGHLPDIPEQPIKRRGRPKKGA